jgi:hypothetical protein
MEQIVANAWYPKTATATISLTSTELQNPSYALAYLYTWTGTNWKCGSGTVRVPIHIGRYRVSRGRAVGNLLKKNQSPDMPGLWL